jgi:hypothetical protein
VDEVLAPVLFISAEPEVEAVVELVDGVVALVLVVVVAAPVVSVLAVELEP